MCKPRHLYLPLVCGKFANNDRVPTLVVVPIAAKTVLAELQAAATLATHPNLKYTQFEDVVTGARLLCSLDDLLAEYRSMGLPTEELDSAPGPDVIQYDGKVYLPYLLSEPDREPAVQVWSNGYFSLRWNALDTANYEKPIESDLFNIEELLRGHQDLE